MPPANWKNTAASRAVSRPAFSRSMVPLKACSAEPPAALISPALSTTDGPLALMAETSATVERIEPPVPTVTRCPLPSRSICPPAMSPSTIRSLDPLSSTVAPAVPITAPVRVMSRSSLSGTVYAALSDWRVLTTTRVMAVSPGRGMGGRRLHVMEAKRPAPGQGFAPRAPMPRGPPRAPLLRLPVRQHRWRGRHGGIPDPDQWRGGAAGRGFHPVGRRHGPGRTRTCNQTVMSGPL